MHRHLMREGRRGGRAFLSFPGRRGDALSARFEGYVASGAEHTGAYISTDDETGGLSLFAGIAHVADVWVSAGSPALSGAVYRRWKLMVPELNLLSVKYHDRALWWEVWHPQHEWHSSTPRWRHGSFHWWDALAGKPVYVSEPVEERDVLIPMPEANYPAKATLTKDSWKRPRWPWPIVVTRCDVDLQGGYIPVPGKGSQSYNCGPDGTFSSCGPAASIENAIGNVVAHTLETRRRRGAPADYAEAITP